MNLAKRRDMSGAFYFYFLRKTGRLGNPGSGKQEAGLMGEHFLLLSWPLKVLHAEIVS